MALAKTSHQCVNSLTLLLIFEWITFVLKNEAFSCDHIVCFGQVEPLLDSIETNWEQFQHRS